VAPANPRPNGSARAVRSRRRRAAPDRDPSGRCQSQRNYEFTTHRRWQLDEVFVSINGRQLTASEFKAFDLTSIGA
jgi:hypothetical protein